MAAARSLAALQTRCATCAVPHRGTAAVYENGYGGRLCRPCAKDYTAGHLRVQGTSAADIAAVLADLFGEADMDVDALLGKVFVAAEGDEPGVVVGVDTSKDVVYVAPLVGGPLREVLLSVFLLALAAGELVEVPLAPGGAEYRQ